MIGSNLGCPKSDCNFFTPICGFQGELSVTPPPPLGLDGGVRLTKRVSCLASLLLSETWKEPKERISISKGCEWWVETAEGETEGETIRRILIAIDTTILRGSCLTKRIKLFSVILKHLSLSVLFRLLLLLLIGINPCLRGAKSSLECITFR